MAKLIICVTVDWEGTELKQANLDAVQGIGVPLTHFICPAYLTRGKNTDQAATMIRHAIMPRDEVALHVHAWESLVRAAGVGPRSKCSAFLDGVGLRVPYYSGVEPDIGHGTPLGVYDVNEIRAIIEFSAQLLHDYVAEGRNVEGFRCGGWLASDRVMEALSLIKTVYDSSATDAALFWRDRKHLLADGLSIGYWLAKLWGPGTVNFPPFLENSTCLGMSESGIDGDAQPYRIQRLHDHSLIEIPDNAALIDYVEEAEMTKRLTDALDKARQSSQDRVIVCGFHQENAAWGVPVLTKALEGALKSAVGFEFRTMREVAERFEKKLIG